VPTELLRVRTFVVANAASTVAGLGFYAYLLTNVLWLQYVWGYDVLEAGLALVPAALVAAVTAGILGPVAERHGYVVVAVPGAVLWAAAYVWYATTVGTSPAFLSQWLPGQLLSGVGVGATLPILGSASLSSVPGGRYALASAVNSSVRQVGGVLGVALLVVLIGTPDAAGAADALRRGWLFSAVCFAGCAVVAAFTGRPDLGRSEVPDSAAAVETRILGPAADLVRPDPMGAEPASLMSELAPAARERLRASSERVVLPAGEVLFREGEPADAAYAVVCGRVDVVTPEGGVRELGAGGVIGELALLTGGTRSATVVARRDSVLERVPAPALHSLLDRDPTAARSLATVLAGQLARPPRNDRQPAPVTVAVVALHHGAQADAVVRALADGMSHWLRVVTLSTPVDGAALERAERDHDRVLLLAADPVAEPAWWASAIRQADAVVAVAAADAVVPERSPLPPGADLVLVGPGAGADRARWSAALEAWQVTSADRPDPAGLEVLSARLAGRSLGLVLGGGGARAFAHIGVLMALEEAHVRVDRVAGTSVGGIIAAMHAMGWGAGEVRERAYAEFVRERPFSDYTLPRSALSKGQRMRRGLTRQFADTRIEGMPRQFRCVSTDLLAREPVVHRRGELVPALMATAALPGLLPPVRLDGRLQVDGGVLDNLPVAALSERSEGPLVAVNIAMGAGSGAAKPDGAPRPVRMPALGETILRTMLIGSGGAVQAAHTEGALVLTPSTMGAGLLEFHQFDAVVEAGLTAGRQLVEEGAEVLSGSAGPR
jgi:predicted acylesterase/phospholipase RssA/CRP-like cAMP-binding protein